MKHFTKTLLAALLLCPLQMNAQKYVGGDISLLPSYEANGAKYYDNSGKSIQNMLPYLKEQGWNAQRVRIFVNPDNAPASAKGEGVRQSLEYILPLAKRIKEQGFALLLDFHYSDTWADPGKQWTPKDWQKLNDKELATRIYDYTREVLQKLNDEGATPDMIQTGNEISYGMDWGTSANDARYCYPNSPASNWDRFADLLKSATKACRETCPNAKIVLHTERVSGKTSLQADNANYNALTGFYNKMKNYGIDYDIIGLSYYPYFHGNLQDLEGAIKKLEDQNYGKNIMIVETGYPGKWAVGKDYDYTSQFPYSDEGQKNFTEALIKMLNEHKEVNGLFWWFPEANENGLDWSTKRVTDKWYNASLFDNDNGKAYSALSVMRSFAKTSGINNVSANNNTQKWSTLTGMSLNSKPSTQGVYIHGNKKIAISAK